MWVRMLKKKLPVAEYDGLLCAMNRAELIPPYYLKD
jgi:hypothetical protein